VDDGQPSGKRRSGAGQLLVDERRTGMQRNAAALIVGENRIEKMNGRANERKNDHGKI